MQNKKYTSGHFKFIKTEGMNQPRYDLGYEAHGKDGDIYDNPFCKDKDIKAHCEWAAGFNDADMECKEI